MVRGKPLQLEYDARQVQQRGVLGLLGVRRGLGVARVRARVSLSLGLAHLARVNGEELERVRGLAAGRERLLLSRLQRDEQARARALALTGGGEAPEVEEHGRLGAVLHPVEGEDGRLAVEREQGELLDALVGVDVPFRAELDIGGEDEVVRARAHGPAVRPGRRRGPAARAAARRAAAAAWAGRRGPPR